MKKTLSLAVPAVAVAMAWLPVLSFAAPQQQQQQQQPGAQAGPHPKSQKELDALKKVQADAQTQNYDQQLTDINAVLEQFSDTDYKDMLLNMAMEAAQHKGDYALTVTYAERIIQANPNDISARVTLAQSVAQHAKDTDLDKDQSVKKIRDYANKALDLLKTTNTPPTGISAEQWPEYKKQLTAQAYDALGQADELEKKYPDAVTNFKTSLDTMPTNSVAMARLAKAYVENKQYDEGIAMADKVLAAPDASAQVKQFAQQWKDNGTKLKGAK